MTNLLRKFFAFVFAWLPLVLNAYETPAKENFVEPVSTQTFVLADALLRGQGMTTDGDSFYFSSLYAIIKTETNSETVVRQNLSAITYELLKAGCKHIGGITYSNGKIYAPIEDSKVFQNLYICTYDAETLKLVDEYRLPLDVHLHGVPWCVADSENRLLYTPRDKNPEVLNIFNIDTMELTGTLELSSVLSSPQGGEIYDGIMYLSSSRGTQPVYAVNLETGEVRTVMERNLFDESEGEGMTILKTDDGAFFHVMDVCSVRLGTHVRHYSFDPESIDWTMS